ncbi:MAG: NAD(P)-binding domain-containing protein [Adlercreutzia sp.]|nr:NAD(P)-binding domain-containing protein [Adlercreutzia sp.]
MANLYAYVGAPSFIGAVEPRLEAAGFKRVQDVASASLVVTFCTSQTALEDLYFGDDGLVTVMAPGAVLIDLSATTPNFAREINAVATVNDLVMVEAPLTVRSLVADPAFGTDNLMAPVACEGDVPVEAQALLEAVFGEVRDAGAPGAAQLVRAGHTLELAAHLVSVIEAQALSDAVTRSVGTAGKLDVRLGGHEADPVVRALRETRFAGAYTVEMLLAELSSARMAADDAELILPQAEAMMHLLELLAVIGGADMAPAALTLIYHEEAAGAAAGLDWTRAEQAYGQRPSEEDDWDDDFADDCGCGHDHGFDDFDFSSN